MTIDLAPIIAPIVVSVVLSVAGALVVSRSAASPAQTAYISALQGRLHVVEEERDEAQSAIAGFEARIAVLEAQVRELREALAERDREVARLYRRLEADERRLTR